MNSIHDHDVTSQPLAAGSAEGQHINMKELQREDKTKADSSFANTSAWPRDLEMDIHPKKCRILIAAANQKAKERKNVLCRRRNGHFRNRNFLNTFCNTDDDGVVRVKMVDIISEDMQSILARKIIGTVGQGVDTVATVSIGRRRIPLILGQGTIGISGV